MDFKSILDEFIKLYPNKWNKIKNIFNSNDIIYPPVNLVFNAFNFFPLHETKVVLLGMDPYIRENQAMGLSFSVPIGEKIPPSLKNIFKELKINPTNGDLTMWAKQKVLLLNSSLTVLKGSSGSHIKLWQPFTDYIIQNISDYTKNCVFILLGNHAKKKEKLINKKKHCILTGVHPSPLSAHRGFFNSGIFKKCNDYLKKHNKTKIEWQIL